MSAGCEADFCSEAQATRQGPVCLAYTRGMRTLCGLGFLLAAAVAGHDELTIAPMAQASKPASTPAAGNPAAPDLSAPSVPAVPAVNEADKVLLDGLLAHSAAGYSVVEKTAVYPIVVSQEGTGSGLFITFDRSGKLDSIQIYEAAEEGEPGIKERAIAQKRGELARRIAGKGYTVLAPVPWPARERDASGGLLPQPEPDRDLTLPSTQGTLRWSALTLSRVSEGGKVTVLRTLKARKPHRPMSTAVYAAADQPVVLVTFQWLPGQAYAEGYNIYDTIEVVALPARP